MLSSSSRLAPGAAALLFLACAVAIAPIAGGESAPSPVPEDSKGCVMCHGANSPGIVEQWRQSTHADAEIGCVDCHHADAADADGFDHHGAHIATVVTPRDCAQCHSDVQEEFSRSHHAKGGNILASLDNYLAETVEGMRGDFDPHSPTPGRTVDRVNGMASANQGCTQCHGSKLALVAVDGGKVTVDDLKPGPDGRPTDAAAVARIARDADGRPRYMSRRGRTPASGASTWTDRSAPAPRATAGTTSRPAAPGSRRTAASATSGPIIRRRRSTRSPSTGWPIATFGRR